MSPENEAAEFSRMMRLAAGKKLRSNVPRAAQGNWSPSPSRDPLGLLKRVSEGRLQELLPLRDDRIQETPFTFFRGSAVIMADDLADCPVSGLMVQACGDAHCLNFGGFATPERNLIFDLNDFDETLRGPWEWDVKRLVTSVLLAGRQNGFKERSNAIAALAAVESYRTRMNDLAATPALDSFLYASGRERHPKRSTRRRGAGSSQPYSGRGSDGLDPCCR